MSSPTASQTHGTASPGRSSDTPPAGSKIGRAELVSRLAEVAGVSQDAAQATLTALAQVVGEYLAAGAAVPLPDLGIIEPRHRGARRGRNSSTGQEMQISASTVPAFKPAAALRRRLS